MSDFRALPPRPNLEHARKEAKALLRRLRSGDPEALLLARRRHPSSDNLDPAQVRLADAQLITARDYGFASWPRLVRYFEDVNRQQYGHAQLDGGVKRIEHFARSIMASHARGREWATRSLGALVPRFYGLSVEEIRGVEVTEEEARLAAARMHGAPSWEVLLERLAHTARNRPELWKEDRGGEARKAVPEGDLDALKRIVADRPELLDPSEFEISSASTLMSAAIRKERRDGADAARPIIEWLEEQGFDRQRELNDMLRRGSRSKGTEDLKALLDMGADPHAVDPGGTPLFELALMTFWNRELIELLLSRVKPRNALWIGAALGDLEMLAGFFGRDGGLLPHARKLRPDWIAAGWPGPVALPDPDDAELLFEALNVAVFNRRAEAIEYLAARGAPVDSLAYGQPLLNLAIGNGWIESAEALIRAGASLDVRGYHPDSTPREAARMLVKRGPDNPEYRRIASMCGVDADAVKAELEEAIRNPETDPYLTAALAAAHDDAARAGSAQVTPENLLMGMLRTFSPSVHVLKELGFQVERFRADRKDRFPDDPHPEVTGETIPTTGDVDAAIEAAAAVAREKKRPVVTPHHLLIALIDRVDGPVDRLLREYGFDPTRFRAHYRQQLD